MLKGLRKNTIQHSSIVQIYDGSLTSGKSFDSITSAMPACSSCPSTRAHTVLLSGPAVLQNSLTIFE